MMPTGNPFAGLYKLFFALLIIGIAVGLIMVKSELANPFSSVTSAINDLLPNPAKKQLEDTKNDIEIQQYQLQKNAETENNIETNKILNEQKVQAADLALQAQINEINAKAQFDALILQTTQLFSITAVVIISIFTIVRILLMIQYEYTHLGLARAQAQAQLKPQPQLQLQTKPTSIWQNPAWKKEQIERAREREQRTRKTVIASTQPEYIPPFYTDEDTLISWEEIRRQFKNPKQKS